MPWGSDGEGDLADNGAGSPATRYAASDPTAYRLPPMPFPTFATGVSIDDEGTVVAAVLESNHA